MFEERAEQLRKNFNDHWLDLKDQADQKINMGKTQIKRAQSIGIIRLIQTQIKTDVFLRETAKKIEHPKATRFQQSILNFSNKWMEFSIENYDALNAKTASKEIRSLRLSEILRVQHYEKQNKNRKTVLRSAEDILDKHRSGKI